MNNFVDAMTSHDALTENGAVTHSTSGTAILDLFFQIGAMRGRSSEEVISLFTKALGEDPLTAMRILFYNRDIRGGQGERQTFRHIIRYLSGYHSDLTRKNLSLIPEFGRWDDLFSLVDTPMENEALELYRQALLSGNALAGKWAPREKSCQHELAAKLRHFMGLSPKAYRKMLSSLTKVVESQMCRKDWDAINYSHVPSVAMKNYRKAFQRHSPQTWKEYLSALERGDSNVKINASAIFPHDIIKGWVYSHGSLIPGEEEVRAANAQWNALPDYMGDNPNRILVMADVSGSMTGGYGVSSATPMDVSVSLALYVAERSKGPFKDFFLTFSGSPSFVKVQGSNIYEKAKNISRAKWEMNTNLQAAFEAILYRAKKHDVSPSEMPETLLIISDMAFDSACEGETNFESISKKYADSQYVLPNIIFWNVCSTHNAPVRYNDKGVGLVSGFSPSILTAILSGDCSPQAVLDRAINSGRYEEVRV